MRGVPTRIDWVKRWLLTQRDITHATLIDAGGGWRLSALIYYLRHKADPQWPIKTVRDHNGVAHYWLPRGWTPKPAKEGRKNGRHN
jgi:hypothetical protein